VRRIPLSGGFTLIEVLVALAVVAIGMAAVLGALSSAADTTSYLRDKTFAEWLALNKIATLRLQGQIPSTGDTNGDTDFAGRSWHWRQDVTATQVQGMVRIDVKVRPAEVKAGDDNGWFVTVSGMMGDAVAAPRGDMPLWGQLVPGGGGSSSSSSAGSSRSGSSSSSTPGQGPGRQK
jgi:general secretion pathway protein I